MKRLTSFFGIAILAACATISPFDQVAYQQSTSMKASALFLMGKASDPYATHLNEINQVKLALDQDYEYSKGRPHNQTSTAQWAIIKDPSRHSLAGFLELWREKTRLNQILIENAREIVSRDFDQIIELESGKIGGKQ